MIDDRRHLFRALDPETSRAAAYSIPLTEMEAEVYAVIKAAGPAGIISDEVRRKFGPDISYSSVTARYKALKEKGRIKIIGQRPGESGRKQSVMVAVDREVRHDT